MTDDKLKDIYPGLQQSMAAALGVNRRVFDHPGAKGDGAELKWAEFFKCHLPSRYTVRSGFVIDHHGNVSEQIDLIIYDSQYTPHLFNLAAEMFVPAESVYAVLEVKQEIDKAMVEYAGKKAASVRCLERTSAHITHAGGRYRPRPPSRILAGIVALDSGWSPPFGTTLGNVLAGLPENHQVDFGCAAAHGGFEAIYGEDGVGLAASSPEHSLVFFVFALLHRLQSVGTVTAINYEKYKQTVSLLPQA